jgi:GTP-binding protein
MTENRVLRADFVTSAASSDDIPAPASPEIALVGRSNVGKSSLINTLVGRSGWPTPVRRRARPGS